MTYEDAIKAHLRDRLDSASHSLDHLDAVLSYARGLAATYGGDDDVLTAAALLHDLGRNDKRLHGAASAEQSAQLARGILDAVAFPAEKIPLVLVAIGEHDQPELRPTALEGRILKDADFLAGFGAVGIARAALWTGESGGTIDNLLDRLERKMPARLASLEFPQSRQQAAGEYLFVRLFVEKLRAPAVMSPLPRAPYVVIEGISGAGKSTQADLLAGCFGAALRLHEPTPWFKPLRDSLAADLTAQAHLLLLDRYLNLRPQIESALASGTPVISDRSYLSSMVYQSEPPLSAGLVALLHQIIPQPTHLFLLDVPAETALHRIEARGGERGRFETPDRLAAHRARFLSLRAYFPHMQVIDADAHTPAEIHDHLRAAVLEG